MIYWKRTMHHPQVGTMEGSAMPQKCCNAIIIGKCLIKMHIVFVRDVCHVKCKGVFQEDMRLCLVKPVTYP
ncbi:hypothetical protein MTR67_002819 [Solanum verrucosum]|uniref:Uncharacterized protein n=1 Tax=Solanum verrucosum TaxID=315347 RepID=A0AAF0PQW8_SOLVR|nr:hypothetical protein MTR67_002819 [Solanum verrucosum]